MSLPPAAELAALRAEYRDRLSRRMQGLASLGNRACDGQASAEELSSLLRELHTVAGSAKVFGFPEAGRAAAQAESFALAELRPGAALEAARKEAFSALLAELARGV